MLHLWFLMSSKYERLYAAFVKNLTSAGEALITWPKKTPIIFDSIDFESYRSQWFILKRMICHCGLSYKFIMPLCHHPWNHHQNVLRTMITLDDNKIMMINHFMKCVTHKLSRSYLSKSESKCHIQGVPIYRFCIGYYIKVSIWYWYHNIFSK